MTDIKTPMELWGDADMGECDCRLTVDYELTYDYDAGWVCDGATVTLIDAQFGGAVLPRYQVAAILGETHLAARETAQAKLLARDWTPDMLDYKEAAE